MSRAPIRFRDLLGAEAGKVCTLPATWFAVALAAVANVLLGLVARTGVVAGGVRLAPVHVFIAVAVFAAGSEYPGQVRVSLLAVPDRGRLFAAKSTVCLTVSAVAAGLVVLPGHAVQHAAVRPGVVAEVAAYLLLALIGYGGAVITRAVVTPLAVLAVAALLFAPLLRGPVPDLVRLLPHDAALSLAGLPGDAAALGRGGGLLVLSSWAAGCVGAAWFMFVRRDNEEL